MSKTETASFTKIIGFTGPQGSGKTTALYKMAHQLKMMGYNVYIHKEVARLCPFEINERSNDLSQGWIFTKQLNQDLETISDLYSLSFAGYDYILSDRTILDSIYYTHRINSDLASKFYNLAISYVDILYNYIVKMDLNPEYLKGDGHRSSNLEFAKEIQSYCDYYTGLVSEMYPDKIVNIIDMDRILVLNGEKKGN